MSETPLTEVQAHRDDTLTPREVRVCSEGIGYVLDLDVAPDGTVVMGTTSMEVVFARVESPELESIPHAGASVGVSPDGRFLATSLENGARLRDFASGKVLQTYEGEQPSRGLCFDRTSTRFISTERHRGLVWVHDVASPTRQLCSDHAALWRDAAWLDANTILACGQFGELALWNADTREFLGTRKGQPGDIHCIGVSPGSRYVVTGSTETVALWEAPAMRPVVQVRGLGLAWTVAVTADGRFAWCTGRQSLALVELQTGRFGVVEFPVVSSFEWINYCVALLPGGTQAVSSGPDGKLRLWELPECVSGH